jgi:hypothetical protein
VIWNEKTGIRMILSNLIPLLAYVVLSVFIGFLGKHKKIGKINAWFILLLISLLLTPLVGLIFLFVAKVPNPFEEEKKFLARQYKCYKCGWKFDNKFEFCPHCNTRFEEED